MFANQFEAAPLNDVALARCARGNASQRAVLVVAPAWSAAWPHLLECLIDSGDVFGVHDADFTDVARREEEAGREL